MQQINRTIFQKKDEFHIKIRAQKFNSLRKQARSNQSSYNQYIETLKNLLANNNLPNNLQALLKVRILLHSITIKQRNTWMDNTISCEFINFIKQKVLPIMNKQQQLQESQKIMYEIGTSIIFILSENPDYLSSVGILTQQCLQSIIFECLKQFEDKHNMFFGCLNFCGNVLFYQSQHRYNQKCLQILSRINIQQLLYLIMIRDIQLNQLPQYYSQLLWFSHSYLKLLKKKQIYCQYHKFIPEMITYTIWIYNVLSKQFSKDNNLISFEQINDIFGIFYFTGLSQSETLLRIFYEEPYKNVYNQCLKYSLFVERQTFGSVLQFTLFSCKINGSITLNCFTDQILGSLLLQLAKQKPNSLASEKCKIIVKIFNYMIINETVEDRCKTAMRICSILQTFTMNERQSIFTSKLHLDYYCQFTRLLAQYIEDDCEWLTTIIQQCIERNM